MNTTDLTFLGTGWSFPPEFIQSEIIGQPAYGVKMLTSEADINSSLSIIFATALGERVMRPTFGADLFSFVQESINQQTITLIKAMISTAINYHEPRVIVEAIDIITETNTTGMIEVSITYTIISINTRYNYVYPFYIQEGTNLTR